MRKVIVNNFVTVDGYYEAKDKTIDGLFEYYHPDYAGDQNFDYYAADRLRAADTLILSGRTSFLGNKNYWISVPDDPNATPIRREIAELQHRFEQLTAREREVMKLVISGMPAKEIASVLGTQEVTAKVHRGQVMHKMKATSLVELCRIAEKLAME